MLNTLFTRIIAETKKRHVKFHDMIHEVGIAM